MGTLQPDYKRIYTDILNKKYPEKKMRCESILMKEKISVLDVIQLNKEIFGVPDAETARFNQKHRSYNPSDIIEILEYQKKNKLNNIQLALRFKLSRNTVAKWKKMNIVKSGKGECTEKKH
ncbi:helix-turn-helix domain-containing protein [Epilithonimonas xixisoli]|uniref:Uncharacterized protein n=1 Tax=Epilithonimonas xixisoli TaxID=1476462 RepID=A0A4R8I2U5_9FLAO|nr:helix-turn-helix domain-containing protein [Epilithonimonas xixisoli]TDX82564.1 hypothetical protein B0I22_2572 [Epilithonimonas xixisoli]